MTDIAKHLREVSLWLEQNTISFPTPNTVTVSGFDINWNQMSGHFYLSLDDLRISDAFRLSLGQNGWVQYHPPMFHSPLGAPASFSSIDLTEDTHEAISEALKAVIPRLKPLGLDPECGRLIVGSTPLKDRIFDFAEFSMVKSKTSNPAFAYTVKAAGR